MLPEGAEVNPDRVNQLIIERGVTHLTMVTVAITASLRSTGSNSLKNASRLRYVVQCGARLTWSCIREFAEVAPASTKLINAYGASESIITTWEAPKNLALFDDTRKRIKNI